MEQLYFVKQDDYQWRIENPFEGNPLNNNFD